MMSERDNREAWKHINQLMRASRALHAAANTARIEATVLRQQADAIAAQTGWPVLETHITIWERRREGATFAAIAKETGYTAGHVRNVYYETERRIRYEPPPPPPPPRELTPEERSAITKDKIAKALTRDQWMAKMQAMGRSPMPRDDSDIEPVP